MFAIVYLLFQTILMLGLFSICGWFLISHTDNNYYAVLGITYCLMWNLFEFVYLQENNQEVFVDFVEVLTDVIDVVSNFNFISVCN